ncbi:hypothetical protein RAJCM14343_3111 [Rhodococcus aetherivorans]|uniref:Uncharacterized protein n=1 Tax=Rhodococcus aetherivorans TaxID=191292 RepID=A0ABQ0YMR0_9NOCA|nr:hypothetical protein RAJCM14343_3111 [Rhodococcus aetherivorans]
MVPRPLDDSTLTRAAGSSLGKPCRSAPNSRGARGDHRGRPERLSRRIGSGPAQHVVSPSGTARSTR